VVELYLQFSHCAPGWYLPGGTGGHVLVTEFRGMTLNCLFCADIMLWPLDFVILTDFTYKYVPRTLLCSGTSNICYRQHIDQNNDQIPKTKTKVTRPRPLLTRQDQNIKTKTKTTGSKQRHLAYLTYK